jgi:hypothetical protein
LKEEA